MPDASDGDAQRDRSRGKAPSFGLLDIVSGPALRESFMLVWMVPDKPGSAS